MKFLKKIFSIPVKTLLVSIALFSGCNSVTFVLEPKGPNASFDETIEVWTVRGLSKKFPEIPDLFYFRVHVPPDFVGKKIRSPISVTPLKLSEYSDVFKEVRGRELKESEKNKIEWLIQIPKSTGLRVDAIRKTTANFIDVLLAPQEDPHEWEENLGIGPFREHDYTQEPFKFSKGDQPLMKSTAQLYQFRPTQVKATADGQIEVEITQAYCTAFSVGPGLVVTNAHCIANHQDCRFSAFRFSNTTVSLFGLLITETFEDFLCKKIRSFSRELDFALVEVHGDPSKKYGKIPLDLDPKFFKPGTHLRKFVANPSRDPVKQSFACKVEDSLNTCLPTELSEDFSQHCATHYTVRLSCDTNSKSGDSGGAILDSKGNVVGLNWGSQTERTFLKPGPLTEDETDPVALDQNFSLFTPSWAIHSFLKRSGNDDLIKTLSAP